MVFLCRYGSELWMFDCGEGTQTQLMKSPLKAGKVNRIFITHLHGDHLYGITGLLCTISQSNQREAPVSIYGPLGLTKYLRVALGLSRSDLMFRFRVIEMIPTADMYTEDDSKLCNVREDDVTDRHPCEDEGSRIAAQMKEGVPYWTLIDDGPLKVTAGRLEHRIPSFGFIMEEEAQLGKFIVEKLESFGLSRGPVCQQLMSGHTVTSPTGAKVTKSDVTGPDVPGRKVVICGDSNNSSYLAPLVQNVDVFVHETTLENSLEETAVERGHSTPQMTAKFAKQLNARLLIITHFSQRYTMSSRKPTDSYTVEDLLRETRDSFGENCEAADDLKLFTIKMKQ